MHASMNQVVIDRVWIFCCGAKAKISSRSPKAEAPICIFCFCCNQKLVDFFICASSNSSSHIGLILKLQHGQIGQQLYNVDFTNFHFNYTVPFTKYGTLWNWSIFSNIYCDITWPNSSLQFSHLPFDLSQKKTKVRKSTIARRIFFF